MSRFQTLLLSLSLASASLLAQYQYYYTDSLTSIGSSWTTNGTVSATSAGLTATSSSGGSLIYNPTMPGPTGEYEVATTITLNTSCTSSCGTYINYLDASSNALAGGSSDTGSFYDVELQNPAFSGGACTATLALNKYVSGTFTMLASLMIPCSNGMEIRAMHLPFAGSALAVYASGVLQILTGDSSLMSGQPGVGARGTPSGSSISPVQLGQLDTTAPNAINASLVGTSSFANRVDIQSPGTTDNVGGTGVAFYQVYRNSTLLANDLPTLDWSDTTVSPSTSYTYEFVAYDYDLNVTSTSISVTTPGSGSVDPRRVGVRPTGAYWGANPEQIDLLSGNLSYSLPLLKAMGRNGWSVGFSLSYNAENWRKDSGGTWNLGRDVGYGYGWKLLAGSITPYWAGYSVLDHFTFTDSTGAEYRLTNNNNGVWTSAESIYLSYNANTGILYFPDGSFWIMGAVSAGAEQDAGTYYPTVMEDTNGNQILISYAAGVGVSWTNSRARITSIADVRATDPQGVYYTYQFTYNSGNVPHLTSISNSVGTGENYSFSYYSAGTLYDPFAETSYGSVSFLQSATVTANSTNYAFYYDDSITTPTSGDLTELVLPYGAYLIYTYSSVTYSGSRIQKEIVERSLSKDGTTGSQTNYPFYHESGTSGLTIHACASIDDPGGLGEKYWAFSANGANQGLATYYQGRSPLGGPTCSASPGSTAMTQSAFTWTQDSAGNNYIGEVYTTADPGQSYAVTKATTQAVDTHGNVIQVNYYDWSNFTTPARTYLYSYLSSSSYTSRYIFNRLTSATVEKGDGTGAIALASVSYDQFSLGSVSGAREWDSNYTSSVTARGNPTTMTDMSGNTTTATYNLYGNTTAAYVNGVASTASVSGTTNYAAPDSITVNSTLTTSMTYSSFLGVTSQTAPDTATVDIGYDALARPASSQSTYGAWTYNVYTDTGSSPNVCTSVNTRWTQTFLDGLGRTLKVLTGSYSSSGPTTCSSASGATILTEADTTYGSCGCSPLGKLMSQTLPYTYGGNTGASTAYTYDGIGRTTQVNTGGSDTSGETTYSYAGNTVTVTQYASGSNKKKVFTMDAFGDLTQVVEDPSGLDYVTTYSYDLLGHLSTVAMTRSGVTQNRSFSYSGNQLSYATNPENGTVHYTYYGSGHNGYGKIASRTDNKGQAVQYTYDSYARLTGVQRYPSGLSGSPDPCQAEVYTYDSDGSGYSQNVLGRLASAQYMGGNNPNLSPLPTCDTTFTEQYSYATSGGPVGKRLNIQRTETPYSDSGGTATESINLDASFTYDNEGRMTGEQYPSWVDQWGDNNPGPNLAYSFDSMGRLNTLTEQNSGLNVIGGAAYGPANELTQIYAGGYGGWAGETRTYNSLKQLTSITSSAVSMQYHYPSTNNNGKIDYQIDNNLSGEQVNSSYDTLNRLIEASVSGGWSQGFTYDGFGNLDTVTGTDAFSTSYNTSTNQPTICADLNGNTASMSTVGETGCYSGSLYTYDVENRIAVVPGGTGAMSYSYAPGNKRVWRGSWTGSYGSFTPATDEVTFWSVTGQKLASYQITFVQGCCVGMDSYTAPLFYVTPTGTNYYFGAKLIKNGNGNNWVYTDRLGSVGRYYPYGQDKGSSNPSSGEKFTGYLQDAETGNDYAMNRYYGPGAGRFFTPDRKTGSSSDPGSWNKYTYAGGDPTNNIDPGGQDWCPIDDSSYAGCDGVGPDENGTCYILDALGGDYELEGVLGCETYVDDPTGAPGGGGFPGDPTPPTPSPTSEPIGFGGPGIAGLGTLTISGGPWDSLQFQDTGTSTVVAGVCITDPELCVVGGALGTIGITIYVGQGQLNALFAIIDATITAMFSKGGNQEVGHSYIWATANFEEPGDPCGYLKRWLKETSKKDPEWQATKATWKYYCRGKN